MMEPLRIAARMADGRIVTTEGWLTLDSVVAWAWMMLHHPERMEVDPNSVGNEWIDPMLPFERRGEGDAWYYACSFGMGRLLHEETQYRHKRFDGDLAETYVDFGKRRGVVPTQSGPYKSCRMPMFVHIVPEIVWYAVGDRQELERLLPMITHLGKDRSRGYGLVESWEVRPWHSDWSERLPDGRLTRSIPANGGTGDMITGIRPPYWRTEIHAACWTPENLLHRDAHAYS